ncbi:Vesicular acetylcholine transporter [Durusdinium trenchii]|uniref:Vesicular acetylcholine transporter n=1 Tax=Durusdinium trenchii TaxID=1381693 RepID=A0ABP0K355_9DINO
MGTKADGQYSKRSTRSKSIAVSDRGIWEGLLTEAATLSRAPDAKVLCLGRPGIGKRSLVQALHQHACPLAANTEAALKTVTEHSRAVGLEFAHFGARDPELEEARAGQDFHCPAACSASFALRRIPCSRSCFSRA